MRPANPAGDVLCLPEFELPGVFQSHPMTPEYLAEYIAALQHILDGGKVESNGGFGEITTWPNGLSTAPPFHQSWTYLCLPKPAEAWVVCWIGYGNAIGTASFQTKSAAEAYFPDHNFDTKPWIVHIVEPQT
jgi:hypothetical protein